MKTSTLSRKQREIQERSELILDVARKMLVERGYLGLSMDRIAEATEYSKGTIYHHFSCKEDVMAGLCEQSVAVRRRLFEQAAMFRGSSRERITAIGVADAIFCEMFPDHHAIENVVKAESVWDKASEERRDRVVAEDNSCLAVIAGVIRDGIAAGDLSLQEPYKPEHLAFGLWSMAWGARSIIDVGLPLEKLGLTNPEWALRVNYQVFLDGYGWQKLSSDFDYGQTVERVREEVFGAVLRSTAGS